MLVKMLRCKLHRATVTEADLHYQDSLKIDNDLIRAAGFLPNEPRHDRELISTLRGPD